MALQTEQGSPFTEGAAFPWILEHLLAYPGTYELPLRTMYTLNSTSQTPATPTTPPTVVGNAFPPSPGRKDETGHNDHVGSTVNAAAQLRANLMTQISQQPAQPASLPPSFITSFVRKCFPTELGQVDFPQALTSMDYLKDLECRRRNEVLAALVKLGVDRSDLGNREQIAEKYPNVVRWIETMEEKERKVEALYTHVYLGLRRWTLINEMSLTPFNKSNCIAMLNTLYPPTGLAATAFVQPTAQLTQQILNAQRVGFFRYITAVEKNGAAVLSNLMAQHKRHGEQSGWPKVRDDLDAYLRTANAIIDECYEVTGRGASPVAASFSSSVFDDDNKRKVDSGISFGSGYSSNRSSGQSHVTRPSTSSSVSGHSRHGSKEKHFDKQSSSTAAEEEDTVTVRPVGSTLERIARELRKIGSRSNIREEGHGRPTTSSTHPQDVVMNEPDSAPPTPGRGLRIKRSLRNMRSSSRLRSSSRNGSNGHIEDVPTFVAAEMKRSREVWEAQQRLKA